MDTEDQENDLQWYMDEKLEHSGDTTLDYNQIGFYIGDSLGRLVLSLGDND